MRSLSSIVPMGSETSTSNTRASVISSKERFSKERSSKISRRVASLSTRPLITFTTFRRRASLATILAQWSAMSLASTAYTRRAPASAAKHERTPLPAPTSITIAPSNAARCSKMAVKYVPVRTRSCSMFCCSARLA